MDGKRAARVGSEDDLRAWVVRYREDHQEEDPDGAHLQILERGTFAWLVGGKLLDVDRFL